MSRSEPKPKIIYRNLEDIVRGSSQKIRQPTQLSSSVQKKPVGQKIKTLCSEMNRSSSRHSLESKPKITFREASRSTSKRKFTPSKEKDVQYESYRSKLHSTYAEMEQMLRTSKNTCLQLLDHSQNDPQALLKKVQTMSKLMKDIFRGYLNRKREKTQMSTNNSRILTEISSNGAIESIHMLSLQNQRKIKNNRLKNCHESRKDPSVYQLVLMKKR